MWHISSLNCELHKQLLTASAKALRVALHFPDPMISYYNLHKMANRATPAMFLKYKSSLLLYRTLKHEIPENDWLYLHFDQIITTRQSLFSVLKTNKYNVGMNVFNNKLHAINGKILLDWLNLTIDAFKIMCKKNFLIS